MRACAFTACTREINAELNTGCEEVARGGRSRTSATYMPDEEKVEDASDAVGLTTPPRRSCGGRVRRCCAPFVKTKCRRVCCGLCAWCCCLIIMLPVVLLIFLAAAPDADPIEALDAGMFGGGTPPPGRK